MLQEHIVIDELFNTKAHRLKPKKETIDELVYSIAKKVDSSPKNTKVFVFSVAKNDRAKRYIQLKIFRQLKKLYGIHGWQNAKDREKMHLKRV